MEVSITVISPEDELMDLFNRKEREELCRRLESGLETQLTPAQRRRLWMYLNGATERQIAELEAVRQQSISDCLRAAIKKLKNFFKTTL